MTRAGRIHAIISKLKTYPKINMGEAWEKVFDTEDIFTAYRMLGQLHREVELLEIGFLESAVPEELYTPVIARLKAVTTHNNFKNPVQSVLGNQPDTIHERLYGLSHSFGENEKEVELDINEDILRMSEAIGEVEDADLKEVMRDVIKTLDECNTAMQISGGKGLQEIYKRLYCTANYNIDNIVSTPATFKKSFINAYTKVKNSLNESHYLLGAPDKFADLIEIIGKGLS